MIFFQFCAMQFFTGTLCHTFFYNKKFFSCFTNLPERKTTLQIDDLFPNTMNWIFNRVHAFRNFITGRNLNYISADIYSKMVRMISSLYFLRGNGDSDIQGANASFLCSTAEMKKIQQSCSLRLIQFLMKQQNGHRVTCSETIL